MQAWLTEHYVVAYVLIVLGMAFVYEKVFRPRKLPVLKNVLVYFAHRPRIGDAVDFSRSTRICPSCRACSSPSC